MSYVDKAKLQEFSTKFWEAVGDKIGPVVVDSYYKEIKYWKERLHDTTCYFVEIPVADNDDQLIQPYLNYAADLTPNEYARSAKTTFTCSGIVVCLQDGDLVRGHVISRGKSVYDNTLTNVASTFKYVSINEDRTVSEFSVNGTTQQQMLANGAYTVFCAYYRLIENGVAADNSATTTNEGDPVSTTLVPYAAMGVLSDNTLLFLASDGRTEIDAGLNSVQAAQILIDKGCVDAWALDGGGSVSYNLLGAKFNKNIDSNGTEDRVIRVTFNVKKDEVSETVTDAFSKIGEEKQNIIQQLIPYINDVYAKTGMGNYPLVLAITANADLNTFVNPGRYNATSNTIAASLSNCPTSVSFTMTVEYISAAVHFYTLKDYNGDIYTRRNYIYSNANHFSAWKKVTRED